MSTTLTNGLKLPDKGSVDWYADMQSNYTILDGAVGTIAEHTSALARKAPLVHTHTKSDITDFPAYGNAAGTICEGNDSRLSDARTPVAHTHGKADITDLFNSANTWSGENTFSAPCKTLGKKLLTGITDLDDAYYNGEVCEFNPNTLQSPTGGYGNVLTINNAVNEPDNIYNSWITQIATTAGGGYLGVRNRSNGSAWTSWTRILTEDHAVPTVTNTYDLGSSSYQWNNIYSKGYYYNGVAWGLDKENAWAGNNRFYKNVALSEVALPADCTLGFTGLTSVIFYNTRGSSNVPSYGTFCYIGYSNTSPYRGAVIKMVRSTDKRGETNDGYVPDTSFNLWQLHVANKFFDFMEAVRVTNNGTENSLKPITDNATDLGTSTNKWKTLNGINPGALSFPDYNRFEPIDFSKWDVNLGWDNLYTPSEDGWLYAEINDAATNSIYLYSSGLQPVQSVNRKYGISAQGNGSQSGYGGRLAIMIPVRKDIQYRFLIKASTVSDIYAVTFYPCLGNV